MSYDLIIRGGTVVDGTGGPRYRADVAISGDRIVRIGHLRGSDAAKELDASGCIVAPGFIDLHTHYDAQVFWDPYCSISGWHGVTSLVLGNCGFGFAPVRPEARERAMLTMTRTEAIPYAAMEQGMPWDWVTFPEYLDSLERTPKAVNVIQYVPLNPLLVWVLGLERAKAGVMPTRDEHQEMRRLLHEAMDAGAGGFSAQRTVPSGGYNVQRDHDGTPMATDVMHFETLLELAEVLAERDAGFVQLTNATGDLQEDHRQFERLAAVSGRPILYNVVVVYDHAPTAHRDQTEWLDRCRRQGLRVYGQGVTTDAGFTFTFEDWNLFDESPPWNDATTGTPADRLAKLADPARRPDLKKYRPFVATCPIPEMVLIGPKTAAHERFRDLTIGEISKLVGTHPVDTMLDIAVAEDLRTLFYANPTGMNVEYMSEMIACPSIIPGVSDGGAHTRFLTSGRYGTDFITRFVREHETVELETAHYRLSALPAACAGFADRGVLRVGAPADIVVYDFEQLGMCPVEVAHDLPANEWRRIQRPQGYRFTIVNGQVTVVDDAPTNVHAGRLLRL